MKSRQITKNIVPRSMELEVKAIEDGQITDPTKMQEIRKNLEAYREQYGTLLANLFR